MKEGAFMKIRRCVFRMVVVILLVSLVVVASVSTSAEQTKISSELANVLKTVGNNEPITISVHLKTCPGLLTVSIDEIIAQKYGIKSVNEETVDDYVVYYRQERANIVGPYVSGFVEDYQDGISKTMFVPSGSEFCILAAYKSTIYKMAEDERVEEIAFFENYIAEPDESDASDTSSKDVFYGDVNGDGEINMKDVLVMRKYIAGMDTAIDTVFADVQYDGNIDMKDVLKLRKYIAKIIDYIGPWTEERPE